MTNEIKTRVVFLVHPKYQNEVYAFFPELDWDGFYGTSYAQIGQHSPINSDYVRESRIATYNEYAALKNELENNVGYVLDIDEKRYLEYITNIEELIPPH